MATKNWAKDGDKNYCGSECGSTRDAIIYKYIKKIKNVSYIAKNPH